MKYGLAMDTCMRADDTMCTKARRLGSPRNAGPDGMICIDEAGVSSRSSFSRAVGGVRSAGVRTSLQA